VRRKVSGKGCASPRAAALQFKSRDLFFSRWLPLGKRGRFAARKKLFSVESPEDLDQFCD
jgi:hypothetical protein